MSPYDFVLLRYVQDPVAGERLNIGVALLDRENRRLLLRLSDHFHRLSEAFGHLDGKAYRNLVRHLEQRLVAIDEEMRQPTLLSEPPRSLDEVFARVFRDELSCFEPSSVSWGVYENLEVRTQELFDQYVARYEAVQGRSRRDDGDIWYEVERKIRSHGLRGKLKYGRVIGGADYQYMFKAGWDNGKPQVLDAISLDLRDGNRIMEKASHWSGRLYNLAKSSDFAFTGVVAPPQDTSLLKAFSRAMSLLSDSPNVRDVIPETDAEQALHNIEQDLRSRTSSSPNVT
jgi:hypothetical protein